MARLSAVTWLGSPVGLLMLVSGCSEAPERGPVSVNARPPVAVQALPEPPPSWASGLLPPNAFASPPRREDGAQTIVFGSEMSADTLSAWYRSSERRNAFILASEMQEGAEQVLAGSASSGAEFTVRIAPRRGGGSDAVLVVGR